MVAGVPAFIAASDIDPPICPPEPTPTINPPKGGAVFEQLSYDLKGALRGSKAFLDTGFLKGSTPAGGLGVAKALRRYGTSLAGLLEGTAARFPDRLVLVDDQGELTYQELANRARLTAHTLASHGIGPNSRVGIMARNGRGFFIPLAAKGYLGYTVFLLNVGASKNQLADIVKEHKLDVAIFVDSEFDDRFPEDLSDFGCTLIHADAAEGYRTDFDYPTMEDVLDLPGAAQRRLPLPPEAGRRRPDVLRHQRHPEGRLAHRAVLPGRCPRPRPRGPRCQGRRPSPAHRLPVPRARLGSLGARHRRRLHPGHPA